MAFLEKIKRIATGKTEIERNEEAEANKIIRQKVLQAQLKEREIQNVRLAQESIRAKAEAKLKQIRNPRPAFSMGYSMNYGSPFGQPTQQVIQKTISKPKTKYTYVKKGKRYIRKKVPTKRILKPAIQKPNKQWNIISGWN